MSLRALIYNRVSADPSGREVSVKSQDVENRAYCDRMGWQVAGTVTDNDRSASRHAVREREGYREVLAALGGATTHGRIDVLVSWESSRNQRDLAEYVQLRNLCVKHGVFLAYKGRVYDLTRGDDRSNTAMDAVLAEREADIIQDRVMRGIRAGVAAGNPHGTVPFGYLRRYDGRGALLDQVQDPVTGPIVQEIVARIIRGDALHAICVDLNRRGAPTPQGHKDEARGETVKRAGWTSSKIRRLLASRSVIGVRTHRGEPHPSSTWPPLVDPKDYELACAVLADPGRALHHRGVTVAHLLSGLVECAACGGWLRRAINRGRKVYQCAGNGPGTSKGHVSRPQGKMDALITLEVVARLGDPELMNRLAARADDQAAVAAGQEAATLRGRLALLELDVAAGRLSGPAFGRIEAQLHQQITDADARAVPKWVPTAVRQVAGPDAGARWDVLDLQTRRLVIRSLLRIVVHRSTRQGSRTFDPSTIEIIDRV